MAKQLIRFDWAMKRLLRNKANYDILEGFLSELLGEDVTILALLESESNQDDGEDKQNRVDILIEDSKKQQILIEVQNETEQDFMQRIHYGAAKLAVGSLDKGMPYRDIKKIIVVAIVFFDFAEGQDYIYKGITQFRGLRKEDELQLDDVQRRLFEVEHAFQLFPEYYLLKVNQFDDVAKDTLDEWMYFFKHEQLPEGYSAKGLARAAEELDVMKLPEQERKAYERYMDNLSYQASMFESAYYTGQFKGEQIADERAYNEKLEMAKTMKGMGMNAAQIVEVTKLPQDVVERILATP